MDGASLGSDQIECTFSIQIVVCDDIIGNESRNVVVTLRGMSQIIDHV